MQAALNNTYEVTSRSYALYICSVVQEYHVDLYYTIHADLEYQLVFTWTGIA